MLLQLPFHGIDPVFFEIGPVQLPWIGLVGLPLRWYGLMYVLGFVVAYLIMRRVAAEGRVPLEKDDLYDLLFYLILGVMVGGRLGYVLFYDLNNYLEDPLSIVAIWRGGMSFHGGLAGTFVATVLTVRKRGWAFWEVADMIALSVPIGLGLGRIGNFINGELYGRESSLPWAMVFPAGGDIGRHPSQLYESALEGVVLFFFLRWLYYRRMRSGAVFWGLLAGYGLVRFLVEFVREPDAQIGLDLGPLTRGQLLSLPMVLVGFVLLIRSARPRVVDSSEVRRNRRAKHHPRRK